MQELIPTAVSKLSWSTTTLVTVCSQSSRTRHQPQLDPYRLSLDAPNDQAVLGDEIIHINQFQMPTAFAADCGFQAIGWILSLLLQEPTDVPFSGEQAIQWRQLFHKDLVHTDKASEFILQPLTLGGTQTITEKLQTLVVAHGVAEQRGKECAEQLIQALGTTSIHQILQSPQALGGFESPSQHASAPNPSSPCL